MLLFFEKKKKKNWTIHHSATTHDLMSNTLSLLQTNSLSIRAKIISSSV